MHRLLTDMLEQYIICGYGRTLDIIDTWTTFLEAFRLLVIDKVVVQLKHIC